MTFHSLTQAGKLALARMPPVREILIKFLIINSWGKYEEMPWNPTNASSHKKLISLWFYMWKSIPREENTRNWPNTSRGIFLARNISREKYYSQGIFLARYWTNSLYFPHKKWKTYEEYSSRGIFLARNNIARFLANPRIFLARIIVLWGICEELQWYLD